MTGGADLSDLEWCLYVCKCLFPSICLPLWQTLNLLGQRWTYEFAFFNPLLPSASYFSASQQMFISRWTAALVRYFTVSPHWMKGAAFCTTSQQLIVSSILWHVDGSFALQVTCLYMWVFISTTDKYSIITENNRGPRVAAPKSIPPSLIELLLYSKLFKCMSLLNAFPNMISDIAFLDI